MIDRASRAAATLREAAQAHERAAQDVRGLTQAAEAMVSALRQGHKILVFGNGGSAADAQHFVAELVGRYLVERRAWPAIALSTDTSILTALGNDYGFERVFARQIEAHGQAGDIALGITTSGNSPNVVRALEEANRRGLVTMALTGRGGAAGPMAAIHLAVDDDRTPRIQEVHITMLHILCEWVEDELNG
ncbi:MAG: D-sedoheptulose 7-phosphate isomerase [Acidobacteriota bacterium]|nr:D-sedoheptulose 7-phosphate isomerase [Acidobacteriota bacterium]